MEGLFLSSLTPLFVCSYTSFVCTGLFNSYIGDTNTDGLDLGEWQSGSEPAGIDSTGHGENFQQLP